MLRRPSIIHCVVIVWSVVWTPLCRFTAQYSTWPGSYLLNKECKEEIQLIKENIDSKNLFLIQELNL